MCISTCCLRDEAAFTLLPFFIVLSEFRVKLDFEDSYKLNSVTNTGLFRKLSKIKVQCTAQYEMGSYI